jgi:RNA polymerase sigma-70 factor (ECF subfamily)
MAELEKGRGMRTQDGVASLALRRAADRMEATAGRTGYRRRRSPRRPAEERLVAAAVKRAREGDEEALRLLYLLFADDVFGYVLAIVRDEHDAEDVTSEVFARLPRALGSYRPGAAPFAAWLLRVARNSALDHLRAQRTVPFAEVRAADDAPAEEGIARERLASLRDALAALPDDQRQVILLRFVAGLTPAEVAAKLGRSEEAVHALQHRARRRLRVDLTGLGSAPVALAA